MNTTERTDPRFGLYRLVWCASLLLAGTLATSTGLLADEYWTLTSPAPRTLAAATGVAVDGRLYMLGRSENVSTVEIYDPRTDTWSTGAQMLTPRNEMAVAALDGLIYAIGGWNLSAVPVATVEVYDPRTDTWSERAPLRGRSRAGARAAVIDGRLFVLGGTLDIRCPGCNLFHTSTNEMLVYNPEDDSWTAVKVHPAGGDGTPCALDGRIYTIGGANDGRGVYQYDPAADAWSRKTNLPEQGWLLEVGVLDGRMAAVGFGYNFDGLFLYDPATDEWRPGRASPGVRIVQNLPVQLGVVIDGRLYCAGDLVDGRPRLRVLELARPELLTSATTSLPALQAGLAAEAPVEVTLKEPPADGTYPELRVDLAALGEPHALTLTHQGQGRYSGRLAVTPVQNGEFRLPVLALLPGALPRFLYSIALQVWPGSPLPILSEDLAPGWTATPFNVRQLTLAQSEVVAEGSTACALQTRASAAGWGLTLKPETPISLFGYTHLQLAFHPGDLAPGERDRLRMSVVGVNQLQVQVRGAAVDLLSGDWVDWQQSGWQQLEIPLALFEMDADLTELTLAGTLGGTFYLDEIRLVPASLPAPTAVREERGAALPQAFALGQNYPNPFNSETVIEFALPAAVEIELTVFNLAGQRVATLAQGHRAAGSYILRWDGRDEQGRRLASGVYLYRLQAGDQTEARKLLLLR